jgi:DNA-binding PadR family transcriptional regulator
MGRVSRFIEPVVLRILDEKKISYGYEIAESLAEYALTDAKIESAALYRTLRTLEANGYVTSAWCSGVGPARRNYSLTISGHKHLIDWAYLLESLGKAMIEFSHTTSSATAGKNPSYLPVNYFMPDESTAQVQMLSKKRIKPRRNDDK